MCDDGLQEWNELLPQIPFGVIAPRNAGTVTDTPFGLCKRELERIGLVQAVNEAHSTLRPLTVVVNDAHRFTDTRVFLDAFFAIFKEYDVDRSDCGLRLLVAAGSHRPSFEERTRHEAKILGGHRERFDAVCWHDARDRSGLTSVGSHTFHRWMAEGGYYLACGSMEPHYFAGVTGAHKTLTVGVMSVDSLTANHVAALSLRARGLATKGNPVYEGIRRAIHDLEDTGARLLTINQVLVGNRVIHCAGGSPLAAFESALPIVRHCFGRVVESAVDLVVAQVLPPLDRDLYQADKGIKNCEEVVTDGGVLVLESRCEGGLGMERFVDLLRVAPTPGAAAEEIRSKGYCLGDHKAVRLRRLTSTRGVRIGLISAGIDPAMSKTLGMEVFPNRSAALPWVRSRIPRHGGRGLLVEDAGNLFLELAGNTVAQSDRLR